MKKLIEFITENGIEALSEQFSVKVKEYDRGDGKTIFVLNYDQIETPKNDITNCCRGVIVMNSPAGWEVVCSSFERFFNFGEGMCQVDDKTDLSKLSFPQKVDGSLMKVWFNRGTQEWVVGTRGTAFAESDINGNDITFAQLFDQIAGKNWREDAMSKLYRNVTYLFELTSPMNRVVTRYDEESIWLLSAIENITNNSLVIDNIKDHVKQVFHNVKFPKVNSFSNVDEMLKSVHELENLEEGYVGYIDGKPVVKVKSPAYVAAHRIKGEGLTPKRIMELIVINEHEEYLAVFPEDEKYFEQFIVANNQMIDEMLEVYTENAHVESQKEFALVVKDYPFAAVMFKSRQLMTNPVHVLNSEFDQNGKVKMLSRYMDKFNEKNC